MTTVQNGNFGVIMNKIHRLEKALIHLRSLGVRRANSSSARCFSTSKDSEGQSNESHPTVESGTEKDTVTQTKENARETTEPDVKLSGFAQSYEKFSHIDDKKPETPQTFASLIRNSKFVDVNISTLQLQRTFVDRSLLNT